MLAPMNWPQLLIDLSARGYTQPEIAKRCGCSQSMISDLSRGKTLDPRFSLGLALRQMHARTARKKAAK